MNNTETISKPKEERLYVKSNKGKKIELKNLDTIKVLVENNCFDEWTSEEVNKIKNITFKNNIIDIENRLIVSSIRLVKISKLGRKVTPMIWEYYKNRGNLDVNQIIKEYGRDNLIINYSLNPKNNKKKSIDEIKFLVDYENDDKEIIEDDDENEYKNNT